MTATIYSQTDMNAVVFVALFAIGIALVLGIRIGVRMERKDPEPRKVRRLVVVNTKSAIGPNTVLANTRQGSPKTEWDFMPREVRS